MRWIVVVIAGVIVVGLGYVLVQVVLSRAAFAGAKPLAWNTVDRLPEFPLVYDAVDAPAAARLRAEYDLDSVVASADSEYDRIAALMHWVHRQWEHDGDNLPSRGDALTILEEAAGGEGFRCVEYARVYAACARALGLPARVLGLMRRDVATAESGAGHVVVEVWSEDFDKWVYVDAQEDVIPELDGEPLNAVEFQAALHDPKLGLRTEGQSRPKRYLYWIAPYLYYFNFNTDQRQFAGESREGPADDGENQRILLVPAGAEAPESFQGQADLQNALITSNPAEFYPRPEDAVAPSTAGATR